MVVRDLTNNQERTIKSDDVVAIKEVGTLMPDGLLATLSDQDKYDLVAFMSELGKNEKLSMSSIDALIGHAHGHHPAEFDMPREPLDKAAWPSWQAHINRDRVYDYYAKRARHFRNVKPRHIYCVNSANWTAARTAIGATNRTPFGPATLGTTPI